MMAPHTAEDQARQHIDALLAQAGWLVCDVGTANIHAARGVAIREFPLKSGYGFADYLLYVDGKAAGVIEAKREGVTLSGVEIQSDKYTKGLPDGLPCWDNPLPFSYQSTGMETRFTNGLDPEPRSRPVFAFHKPDTLAAWFEAGPVSKKHPLGLPAVPVENARLPSKLVAVSVGAPYHPAIPGFQQAGAGQQVAVTARKDAAAVEDRHPAATTMCNVALVSRPLAGLF